ncbi:MAG: sugar ABC transporter substrate-binding protein, partial [Rhizobiaceae bacterium]
MKLNVYNQIMAAQASRRSLLKGAAGLGALAALNGAGLGAFTGGASAAETLPKEELDLRKQILQIPGVGKGQPTDA